MVDGRDRRIFDDLLGAIDWDSDKPIRMSLHTSPPPPPDDGFPRVKMPFEFTPVKAHWEFDHGPRYNAIMDQIHGRIMLIAQIRLALVEWVLGRFFTEHPGLFFQILAHRRRTDAAANDQ